ncbi:MAG: DUF2752 domain-containing protein [Acidimicrobiales bacterium]
MRLWIDRSDRDPSPALSVVAVAGLVTAMLLARFGMPPVNVHSPLHFVGVMDPACGMTRGSAATLRGDLGRAWWYNPASPLVIAGGIAVVVRWFVGQASGRWVCARLAFTRLTVVVAGVAFVALDVYQQLHVDRLR